MLVSDAASDAGYGRFGILRVRLGGRAAALGYRADRCTFFGRRLLPERQSANLPEDFGQHAKTLTEQYAMTGSTRLYRVLDGSRLLGKSRDAIDPISGISLIAVSGTALDKAGSRTFAAGDVLVLRGRPEVLSNFADTNRLEVMPEAEGSITDMLFNKQSGWPK